jgi:hypothetical protein
VDGEDFSYELGQGHQVLKSEVENSLNASFVIVGLVANVPNLNNS